MSRHERPAPPVPVLGPGGEFDLIRSFYDREGSRSHAGVLVGAGDDCAVVAPGVVLSTDMSVEGVHFRREWITVEEIGYRAAAAALSDLAAMAALPVGALVSLAVPVTDTPEVARQVMTGVGRALERVGGVLLGGDLTRSPGPLVIDVTVVGEASEPILRRGSLPGDEIWVTGALGAAGAAVRAWTAGAEPGERARRAFAEPVPRIPEARWLAERGVVRAMLDVSDGLGGDAGHLAAAGDVGIELEAAATPVHRAVAEAGLAGAAAVEFALRGGEDYELCFSSPPGRVDAVKPEFERVFSLELTRVGRVVQGAGVALRDADGALRPLPAAGYQHFETSS
jgi:thiamine-monophosphate kinase